jgi:hypothetical protein
MSQCDGEIFRSLADLASECWRLSTPENHKKLTSRTASSLASSTHFCSKSVSQKRSRYTFRLTRRCESETTPVRHIRQAKQISHQYRHFPVKQTQPLFFTLSSSSAPCVCASVCNAITESVCLGQAPVLEAKVNVITRRIRHSDIPNPLTASLY